MAENLILMKTFHNMKRKVYRRGKVNIIKGVIRKRDFSLVKPEEIEY